MFKSDKGKLLTLDNVAFGYKPNVNILSNISLSINRNEHICIIGANGCGKSTLGKIIVGLYKPTSGSIYFKNKLINNKNVSLLKKACGIVFENPESQFIGLTVQDDIAFGLENLCIPHDKMQSIINKVAQTIGIENLLSLPTSNLSGGQKQLVAIASVLAMEPQIIVFDEATSMLDYESKKQINAIISSLKKHKTIITITHDMDEAYHADKIIVLNKGQIILSGKPQEIFSNKNLKHLSMDKPFFLRLKEELAKG